MNFLHYELTLDINDVVVVGLDRQANVRLLDETNYSRYKRGDQHTYHGGLAKTSPARVKAPRAGKWHLVVDLGGFPGTVRASVNVVRG